MENKDVGISTIYKKEYRKNTGKHFLEVKNMGKVLSSTKEEIEAILRWLDKEGVEVIDMDIMLWLMEDDETRNKLAEEAFWIEQGF